MEEKLKALLYAPLLMMALDFVKLLNYNFLHVVI